MRVRVPVAIRNRLIRLEGVKKRDLPIGGWPSIAALDEWEALASIMQDELAAGAYDVLKPSSAYVPLLSDFRKADDATGTARAGTVIEEYLKAQRHAREARASIGS